MVIALVAMPAAAQGVDTDADGLSDDDELNLTGTDPFGPDSDDDGFNDGWEVSAGSDPLDPLDLPDAPPLPVAGTWGWLTLVGTMGWLGTRRRRTQLAGDVVGA